MPKTRSRAVPIPQKVPLEYAGKWIAWSADGLKIVAVASTMKACETAAERAGFADDQVAFEHVPTSRFRQTGSGL
jgi:hypothetical protein